jgi:hypothetical protein
MMVRVSRAAGTIPGDFFPLLRDEQQRWGHFGLRRRIGLPRLPKVWPLSRGRGMNIAEIEQNVKEVLLNSNQQTFLYDLLSAFGKPKAAINRLQTTGASGYNLSKDPNSVLWKGNVHYVVAQHADLEQVVDELRQSPATAKHKPRFFLATDFDKLSAYDTKTDERLNIEFVALTSHFHFFLPWAGMEKSKGTSDSPADVKAAEKMAKLYDLILADNPSLFDKHAHALNVFLSRVLFCFFAEDTEIFPAKLFSKSIESHTAKDGSDLREYLDKLFVVLDEAKREKTPAYLKDFPYVNGGLFSERHEAPVFTKRSRELLIACGMELHWSEISPDIFGSMFQAVVDVKQRGNMGMHYTSVPNIMKVIEPLFLNDLKAEFESAKTSQKKLLDLQKRISELRVFDPACGSGNFLIIAYKELRKLEIEILNQLSLLNKQTDFGLSAIELNQFYGIELDDFAHEIAILSMWLAEHQMNLAFLKKFSKVTPALPLKASGKIVRGNAHELDWDDVCPSDGGEVFVLGNPPYLGSSLQSEAQKHDMETILGELDGHKNLDYIAAWFYTAAKYISGKSAQAAFVTTNSICQGEQVSLLWPHIFDEGIEIGFAYHPFKWSNNAKKKAGVTCIIVGMRNESSAKKFIDKGETRKDAANINAYLIDYKNIFVRKRGRPLADLQPMSYGSKPADGGHLILLPEEKDAMVKSYPSASKYLKKLIGTDEFLYSTERWCLWIGDNEVAQASKIPPIAKRIADVRAMRLKSKKGPTREQAETAYKFGEVRFRETSSSILVPAHSSENRRCIPMGFLDGRSVVSNSAFLVMNASPFTLGILMSAMHMAWTRTVAGGLETRIRYSSGLVYNTYPLPPVTEANKKLISTCALRIIQQREEHSELALDDLYEPDRMPKGLADAHDALDAAVDRCHRSKPFSSEDERVVFLFKAYEDMMEKVDA